MNTRFSMKTAITKLYMEENSENRLTSSRMKSTRQAAQNNTEQYQIKTDKKKDDIQDSSRSYRSVKHRTGPYRTIQH